MTYYQKIAVALLLAFMLGGTASAESTTMTSNGVKMDSRREEVKAKVKEMKGGKGKNCEALTTRISSRLDGIGKKYEEHRQNYNAHKEHLLAISVNLEAKGISTTKLKADIALLDIKIAKLAEDKSKVQAALENTKSYTCDDSKDEFKSAVEAVRTAQKAVAADAADIAAFIKGTLKQDVIDLRASFKAENKQQ